MSKHRRGKKILVDSADNKTTKFNVKSGGISGGLIKFLDVPDNSPLFICGLLDSV